MPVDADAARANGVLAVFDHRSLGRIVGPPQLVPSLVGQAAPGMSFFPLQDEVVHYAGQPVALVVADSLERAQHAASLVRVTYEQAPAVATIEQGRELAYEPPRGCSAACSRHATSEATSTARWPLPRCASTPPSGSPPTTTTRWKGRRRSPTGSATG